MSAQPSLPAPAASRRPPAFPSPGPAAPLRVALLGYGTIGQAVAAALEREHERLLALGLAVTCQAALVRDPAKPRSGPAIPCRRRPRRVLAGADLVVEALGGVEPAYTLVRATLEAGVPVVTANKTLVAHHGPELCALAAAHATAFAFDAAVLAGVPFIGALARRPLVGTPRRLEGIVNGTSHFVADAIQTGRSAADALAEAVALGYAEPDSRADLGGRDAAEKLAILLQLAGHGVPPGSIHTLGLEALADADFRAAAALDLRVKPVAVASLTPGAGGAWVGPALVGPRHPLAAVGGVDNILRLTDDQGQVVTFSGPGAGPIATARTIVDDVVEAVTHARRPSWTPPGRWPAARAAGQSTALDGPPPGEWFVRFEADRSRLDRARVAERLAASGLPAVRLARHDDAIVARTVPGSWSDIQRAVAAIRPVGALVLPVLDHPSSSR